MKVAVRLMWAVLVTLAVIVFAGAAEASASSGASSASFVYDRTVSASAELIDVTEDGWPEQAVRARSTSLADNSMVYDDRANPTRSSGASGEHRFAPQATLFRAVSTAEADDIARFGGFRAGPNSYEGKLFAATAEDAARYGRINDVLTPGGEPFHIVQTRVPTSLANSFERMPLDSMQAVHVAEAQLGALNRAGSWSIWESVPWVGKPRAGF